MTTSYSFNSIHINGREVEISSILSNTATPVTPFEFNTFSFIRDWLSSVDTFSISTSGSTGTPKSITITREQMKASAQMTIKALDLRESDTALVCLNTQFIAGRMMLVRSFVNNMKIVALEPSTDPLMNLDPATKIDFAAFVPLQLHTMIESPSLAKINTLKSILVGGGSVSQSLESVIKNKVTAPSYQTYGMTETISHIALQLLNTPAQSSSFITLPGIKIYQDDRQCLELEAPYLTEKLITNDIVEIITPTTFKWLGRWDNVINSGGIKIIPETLEADISSILKEFDINNHFVVLGLPDEILGSKLILAFEGLLTLPKDKILSSLKQRLPKYLAPKEIITIPEFSYTSTGKISRNETLKLL
ncbi:MAG TPA: AMP-binding protein [Cyclobacteriaceae bacterium]|nr:AMP-binding protein [Cyclobacteriaceae bacterium]